MNNLFLNVFTIIASDSALNFGSTFMWRKILLFEVHYNVKDEFLPLSCIGCAANDLTRLREMFVAAVNMLKLLNYLLPFIQITNFDREIIWDLLLPCVLMFM